jgi:hypothetical protein
MVTIVEIISSLSRDNVIQFDDDMSTRMLYGVHRSSDHNSKTPHCPDGSQNFRNHMTRRHYYALANLQYQNYPGHAGHSTNTSQIGSNTAQVTWHAAELVANPQYQNFQSLAYHSTKTSQVTHITAPNFPGQLLQSTKTSQLGFQIFSLVFI